MNKNKAFTLIELLLVVAIITLLVALILIPFTAARFKAKDARIKVAMEQVRSVAALYYATNENSYLDFGCDIGEPNMGILCADITAQGGEKPSNGTGGLDVIVSDTAFCAEVRMNNSKYWCVDSTGVSGQYDGNPNCAAGYYSCE